MYATVESASPAIIDNNQWYLHGYGPGHTANSQTQK